MHWQGLHNNAVPSTVMLFDLSEISRHPMNCNNLENHSNVHKTIKSYLEGIGNLSRNIHSQTHKNKNKNVIVQYAWQGICLMYWSCEIRICKIKYAQHGYSFCNCSGPFLNKSQVSVRSQCPTMLGNTPQQWTTWWGILTAASNTYAYDISFSCQTHAKRKKKKTIKHKVHILIWEKSAKQGLCETSYFQMPLIHEPPQYNEYINEVKVSSSFFKFLSFNFSKYPVVCHTNLHGYCADFWFNGNMSNQIKGKKENNKT